MEVKQIKRLSYKEDKPWQYRPFFWTVILCIFCFYYWADNTYIVEQVRAVGRVTPAGKMRYIQHLEGGIVSDILTREGDAVKTDDILFHVKNHRADAELRELIVALEAAQIKHTRLLAELEEKDSVEYSEEMAAKYPQFIESERQLFNARQSEINERLEAMEKRMKQKYLKLDDLDTRTQKLQQELSVSKEQLEIRNQLRRSGAISRSQYLETLSDVKDFETRISRNQKEVPIVKTELGEIINQMEEVEQKWKSELGEQINEVRVKIKTLEERIKAVNDEVRRTAVRSPINGIVNKVNVNTKGGVIQPGSILAELLPVEENLVLEGRINTDQRGKVWPDLPAVARITAYDYTLYGGVEGKLEYISPNSFSDNQNNEYYRIRVSIDTKSLGEDLPIYPGMTADINILAGRVSVLDAITKPFRQIKSNALREK